MSRNDKRVEANRVLWGKRQKLYYCVNCGATDNIQFHHIVPLSNGGTNRETNIVPLCLTCHIKAHDGMVRPTNCKGRPRNPPPNQYEEILQRYADGEIGKAKAGELLGLTEKGKIHLTGYWWYKEWCAQHGIEGTIKNSVDFKAQKKKCYAERNLHLTEAEHLP